MCRVIKAGGFGFALASNPFGLSIGLGENGVALTIGLACDRLILRLAFSTKSRSHLLSFTSDQIEDSGSNFDGVVETSQADVDDGDSKLARSSGSDYRWSR